MSPDNSRIPLPSRKLRSIYGNSLIECDHDNKTMTLQAGTYNICYGNGEKKTLTLDKKQTLPIYLPPGHKGLHEAIESVNKKTKENQKLMDKFNGTLQKIHMDDQEAIKILRDHKAGDEISVKQIKKIYGPNWKKTLACIPLPDQIAKRDKKKAKAVRQARKKNRRRK